MFGTFLVLCFCTDKVKLSLKIEIEIMVVFSSETSSLSVYFASAFYALLLKTCPPPKMEA